jgi:hypothetical protein
VGIGRKLQNKQGACIFCPAIMNNLKDEGKKYLKIHNIIKQSYPIKNEIVIKKGISVDLSVEKSSLYLGEDFFLDIQVHGVSKLENVHLENTGAFTLLKKGTTLKGRLKNGKVHSRIIMTYSFEIQKKGDYMVGQAVVMANGKEQPFFVEGNVNSLNPHAGEQIIYTLRLYNRFPMRPPSMNFPNVKGFMKGPFVIPKIYKKVIKGQEWNVTKVNQTLLPIYVGKLTIPSTTVVFRERGEIKNNLFDHFFYLNNSGEKTKLSSRPITLKVRALEN